MEEEQDDLNEMERQLSKGAKVTSTQIYLD